MKKGILYNIILVLLFAVIVPTNIDAQVLKPEYMADSVKMPMDSMKRMGKKMSRGGSYTPQITPSSPQSKVFQQYIDHPVAEYNGLAQIEIPLYEIELDGLKIPIVLSYHAAGIKFKQYDGDVGAGWSLSVGGYRISRDIRGKEDELSKMYDQDVFYSSSSFAIEKYLDEIMYNWSTNFQHSSGISIDSSPDFFTYSLPSSCGKFIITDRSKMNVQVADIQQKMNKFETDKRLTKWLVTDPQGFRYAYGDDISYREQIPIGLNTNIVSSSIATWALKSVESPLGSKALFKYSRHTVEYKRAEGASLLLDGAERGTEGFIAVTDEVKNIPTMDLIPIEWQRIHYSSLFITELSTENELIEFKRVGKDNSEKYPYILSEISVKSQLSNKIIKKIIFKYSDFNTSSLSSFHRKLIGVNILNEENQSMQEYSLDYYEYPNMSSYPDQWGYYKVIQSDISSSLVLHEEFLDDSYILTSSYDTDPGKIKYSSGQMNQYNHTMRNRYVTNKTPNYFSLKRIIYPTGGSSEYIYEPHYSSYMSNDGTESEPVKGGGLRIKSIKSQDTPLSAIITTNYDYGMGMAPCIPQEGYKHLFADEVFEFNVRTVDTDYQRKTFFTKRQKRTYSTLANNDFLFHISYPRVTKQSSKGKIISDYNIPFQVEASMYVPSASPALKEGEADYGRIYIHKYELWESPTLNQRMYYDQNDILVQLEKYKYCFYPQEHFSYIDVRQKYFFSTNLFNNFVRGKDNVSELYSRLGIKSIFQYGFGRYTFGTNMLSNKLKTLYFPDKSITTTESFIYNSENQLESIRYIDSSGQEHSEKYKYTSDFKTISPYKEMVDKNILTPIIERTKKIEGKEVIKQKTLYLDWDNYGQNAILPNKILTSSSKISGETLEVEFNKYDTKGNILQYTGKDNIPVTYLWSYNSQYPIAEIRNATYTQVEKAVSEVFGLTVEALSKLSNLYKADEGKLQKLRSNVNLSSAQVSTYTYKPLVGMLSATAPNGITTYYEYDAFGRLKRTYYKEGTLERNIESHEYNYRNK